MRYAGFSRVAGSVLGLAVLIGGGATACDSPTDGDTGELEVVVTISEVPISGVDVTATATGESAAMVQDTTDTEGRVVFTDLTPDTYALDVAIPDTVPLILPPEPFEAPVIASGRSTKRYNLIREAEPGLIEVHLTDLNEFVPGQATIPVGTTVRWINDIALQNTVTPDGHSEWEEAALTEAGQTFTHTFDGPGEFEYYNSRIRLTMTGVITVQ